MRREITSKVPKEKNETGTRGMTIIISCWEVNKLQITSINTLSDIFPVYKGILIFILLIRNSYVHNSDASAVSNVMLKTQFYHATVYTSVKYQC